jgi:hypothetical protein
MKREDGPPKGVPHREGGMDAHGYGTKLKILSERPLPPSIVEELLRRMVTEIGERCLQAGARAIGHIKCYLKADQGYAKADIVRLKQGAYAEICLGAPITRGSLVINSIVLGLSDGEVERITMNTIRGALAEYGIALASQEEYHQDH